MWKGILKRKPKNPKTGFSDNELQETTEYIPNPGQGWYRIYTYDAGTPFKAENEWIFKEDKLALVRISLEQYRDEQLPDECLENIRKILRFFDMNGIDIILRIAYDFEGRGSEKEPDLFSQLKDHIIQLAPLIQEWEDRIIVFQGLLLGSWGEMHQSKFLSENRLRDLEKAFRSAGNETIYLALRKPVFLRMLTHTEDGAPGRRTLFNDAIGSSETDMGTFGHKKRKQASWNEAWAREDELAFMDKVCSAAPFGGEAVQSGEQYKMSPADILKSFRQMHLSYLNCEHDKQALNKWKNIILQRKDLWDGVSLYDYIGAHMGYRFCIRRFFVTEKDSDNMQRLTIEIENTGFGNLPWEAQAELVQIDENGGLHKQPLNWDARKWLSGQRVTCTAKIRLQSDKLYLNLWRKWDGSRILFANRTPIHFTGGN